MTTLTEGFPCFFSVVRQMPGQNPQNFCVFYVFLCCSMYYLFCVVLCIVCAYMCTELLPPGGYPIAVKHTISYHIISYIVSYPIVSYIISYIISFRVI
jgi:hypothetical protein